MRQCPSEQFDDEFEDWLPASAGKGASHNAKSPVTAARRIGRMSSASFRIREGWMPRQAAEGPGSGGIAAGWPRRRTRDSLCAKAARRPPEDTA
jgi:hypothetical protein